jgi:hypothetical protein
LSLGILAEDVVVGMYCEEIRRTNFHASYPGEALPGFCQLQQLLSRNHPVPVQLAVFQKVILLEITTRREPLVLMESVDDHPPPCRKLPHPRPRIEELPSDILLVRETIRVEMNSVPVLSSNAV